MFAINIFIDIFIIKDERVGNNSTLKTVDHQ